MNFRHVIMRVNAYFFPCYSYRLDLRSKISAKPTSPTSWGKLYNYCPVTSSFEICFPRVLPLVGLNCNKNMSANAGGGQENLKIKDDELAQWIPERRL